MSIVSKARRTHRQTDRHGYIKSAFDAHKIYCLKGLPASGCHKTFSVATKL